MFWDNPIFANDTWTVLMDGLRIGLSLGGALLLLYQARARQLGRLNSPPRERRLLLAFAVVAFGAYFHFFNPNTRYPDFYHRGEVFHHYLGAKYSSELGYTRIYECSAVAEIELGHEADVRRRELRELSTNLIKPITETYVVTDPSRCKKHFTPDAWVAFKADVRWFWSTMRGSYWDNVYKDHGFNAPPVWIMVAKVFAKMAPAGHKFMLALTAIDVVLHAGIIAMVFWAFGFRVGAIAAVFWACNGASTFYWTGGAFLRQDWLFLLVASLCLARKRMMFLAGAALMSAALCRIVPAVFFVGWGIIMVLHAIRQWRRRQQELLHSDHRRLIAGAVVACGLLVSASIAVTGADSYPNFLRHIAVYRATPLTDHMGLETMLVHDWHGRMRFQRDDNLDDPFEKWKEGRTARHDQLRFVHYGIIALIFGWTVWALRRTKLVWIGQALSAPLVMAVANLPNYYYSFFMITAVLAAVRRELGPVILVTAGASHILLLSYYWVDDKFAAQSWLFGIFSIVLLVAMTPRYLIASRVALRDATRS